NFFDCTLHVRSLDTDRERVILSDQRLCTGSRTIWWTANNRMIASLGEPQQKTPHLHLGAQNLWEIPLSSKSGNSASAPLRMTSWPDYKIESLTGTSDGKRLAFLRVSAHDDVYLGELTPDGKHLTKPRRLTFEESNNGPTAWTPDGRFVLFMSDRNGNADIF